MTNPIKATITHRWIIPPRFTIKPSPEGPVAILSQGTGFDMTLTREGLEERIWWIKLYNSLGLWSTPPTLEYQALKALIAYENTTLSPHAIPCHSTRPLQ